MRGEIATHDVAVLKLAATKGLFAEVAAAIEAPRASLVDLRDE